MLIRQSELDPNWDVWRSVLILHKWLTERLAREEKEGKLGEEEKPETTPEVLEAAPAGDDVAVCAEVACTKDECSAEQPWAPEPAPQEEQSVYVQVAQEQEIQAIERSIDKRIRDSDERDQKKTLIKALRRDDGCRELARLDPDWRALLEQLALDFPNFDGYIEYLKAMCVLSAAKNGVPQVDPVLLNGPPGIGKTFLADRIATIFGAGIVRISMENEQCNGTLVGSADFWSNAKPGRVLGALSDGEFANPLFFLDELDKVNGSLHYNPLSPLYSLLEPETARAFHDLSLPQVALDASHIVWVATSNDASVLPAPLLSRMKRFDIPAPTRDQSLRLASRIFDDLRVQFCRIAAIESLREDVANRVATVSPRRMNQVLREAIGRAVYAGRKVILPEDLRLPPEGDGGRSIGFITR